MFIHPFIDGNGRTARLLMNFILMQAGYPPVIIPVEERSRYYATLKAANEGDLRPFIRFVAEHVDKALQVCELSYECSQTRIANSMAKKLKIKI